MESNNENNQVSGDLKQKKKSKYGISFFTVLILGIISFGASMFGFYESQLLNTYIIEVLDTPNKFDNVAFMVSSSAAVGLLTLFIFGIMSDNTRSKWGRRRPYFLIGGLVGGIAMILYGFSPNFFWCYVLDVIAMGLASNCYYAAQRVIIPDLVEVSHRGRVNSVVSLIGTIGFLIAMVGTIIVEPMFPKELGGETVMNQQGHIVLLSLGGIFIMIAGILGFLFIREPSVKNIPKKKFIAELKETFNLKAVKEHKDFFKLMLAMLVFNIGIQLVLPYIFDFIFKIGTDSLIVVFGVSTPMLIIFIFLSGKLIDTVGRRKVIPILVGITSIGFILIPFGYREDSVNLALLATGFTLVLIGLMGVAIPIGTWLQDLLPEHQRGKFAGINNIASTVNQIIGVAIGGALLNAFMGSDNVAQAYEMAKVFPFVTIFSLLSIPIFLSVKETLKKPHE